jgi:hypothetical protein
MLNFARHLPWISPSRPWWWHLNAIAHERRFPSHPLPFDRIHTTVTIMLRPIRGSPIDFLNHH